MLTVFDIDAHVEEWAETFGDSHFEATQRHLRPTVVTREGSAHWLIQDQIFPKLRGRGVNFLGTPTGHGVLERDVTVAKGMTIESIELRSAEARLRDMDKEGIDVQVLYTTLFLVQPLAHNPAGVRAIYGSWNNWMADVCSKAPDRLKWVAVVDLQDPQAGIVELRRCKNLGAIGVVLLGTEQHRTWDRPEFDPFWAAAVDLNMPLSFHVGWCVPRLSEMYERPYDSLLTAFTFPLLMAYVSMVAGGVLDRHPQLRVGFLELGVGWVPWFTERMQHIWETVGKLPSIAYTAKHAPDYYTKTGQIFVTTEVTDEALPKAIEILGEDSILFASDMPHNDRTLDAAAVLLRRTDISETQKRKILWDNATRYYGLK
jgi:predicted TIM-barrel fold metal-dependent hydrolase